MLVQALVTLAGDTRNDDLQDVVSSCGSVNQRVQHLGHRVARRRESLLVPTSEQPSLQASLVRCQQGHCTLSGQLTGDTAPTFHCCMADQKCALTLLSIRQQQLPNCHRFQNAEPCLWQAPSGH